MPEAKSINNFEAEQRDPHISSEVLGHIVVLVKDNAVVIVIRVFPGQNGGLLPEKQVPVNRWDCHEQGRPRFSDA
jgi:hypothetical protein